MKIEEARALLYSSPNRAVGKGLSFISRNERKTGSNTVKEFIR
jgi:hypothetical protein